MSSCSNAQSTKVDFVKNQNALLSTESHERKLGEDREEEEEEEEDEDADFNPFLKETPSQEASSSLSSEVDGLDTDAVNSGLSKLTSKEQICAVGDSEQESIVQSTFSADGTCEKELKKNDTCTSIKRKSALISQFDIETNQEKDTDLSLETEGTEVRIGQLSNATKSRSPVIEIDNDDAICMRTRARYSLASFTLDELETFLQETDDDDDLQNVDDEEEYRKFLAAVLQGGDGVGLSTHENENIDDEDEDNDADFEIELEELLESDIDENAAVKTRKELDGAGRRPETRQNKRQTASSQCEKKISGQVKRPLRPLLPSLHNGLLAPGKSLLPEATLSFRSSTSGMGLVNGFTPQQIGQLYSLIHEHVQLLIQVFSLLVLDPSRQQIASQIQSLLFELLHKRDDVLALKSVPYPSTCFSPSYICSSVSDAKFAPPQCNIESASTYYERRMCLPQSNQNPSEGRCEHNLNRQTFQDNEASWWVPFVRGPVISVLDVSPLNLVGRYVDDVHSAVQASRKRYLESGSDIRVEKEPLFPYFPPLPEASSEVSSAPVSTAANTALFPHKPPSPAVVNRVLFTDSEDVLLALGLMEYNTDWKAIQQRFLPCKSKHQIFVRQKNRCSSKAPENPIKAVRRMKTSPLTAEEIACIQEGLKVYKFDWTSVWKYMVPHRDPSLLPRQWRVAIGTQKSYKQDASKKERRRLYESKRRRLKAAALENWQDISDKEECQAENAGGEISGAENCIDNPGVAYVHQAFLADWRPDTYTLACSGHFPTNSGEENLVSDVISHEDAHYRGQQHDYGDCGHAHSQMGYKSAFQSLSKLSQFPHGSSNLRNDIHCAPAAIQPKNPVLDTSTSCSKYYYRPYRSRRVSSTHLVRLAPDLPPVNLPPSVRVVSQAAFKGYQSGTSKIYPVGGGNATGKNDNSTPQIPNSEKLGTVHPVKGTRTTPKDSVSGSQLERPGTVRGRSAVAEKGTSTDLQMHPLLFKTPENGNVPYYPLKFSSGIPSSFSFFPGSEPQINLSLLHNPHQQNHFGCSSRSFKSKASTSMSGGIDFHPLLQKYNDMQFQSTSDAMQTTCQDNSSGGMPGLTNRSSNLNEKSNEPDLEIHLNSASGKEKIVKSKELKTQHSMGLTKTVAFCGTAAESQESSAPIGQQGEKNPSVITSNLGSSVHPLVVADDNIRSSEVDDVGDESHPEIVMEQEELSDSEEDIEEHVEFECEEMADSEGEDGSGCDENVEVQDKEVRTSAVENVVKNTAAKESLSEPGVNSDSQVDKALFINGSKMLKMTSTGERKVDESCPSWLSLDSCRVSNPVLSNTKHERHTTGEAPDSGNFALSRPSRCFKKTKSICKVVTEDGYAVDTVEQLSLGPLVSATPRKSRKCPGKMNASLNIGLTLESSSNDVNCKDG
ncbi:hypothetical protein L6164_032218 [Bauhinia variegata]|uniref:Uncharacterized protein n=1 Tax=Bauhinia variegata TaxID=167791 RepID=A0ACB9KN63_BAUVA|nr:hypothetical protein L6164_032218 [Bauhinia variegata]